MAKKNGGGEPPKDTIKQIIADGNKGNPSGKNWVKYIENQRGNNTDKPDNRPAIEGKVADRKKELENQKSQEPDKTKENQKDKGNKTKEPEKEPDKE